MCGRIQRLRNGESLQVGWFGGCGGVFELNKVRRQRKNATGQWKLQHGIENVVVVVINEAQQQTPPTIRGSREGE